MADTSADQSGASAVTSVEVCGEGAAVTRPSSMILTCADDGEVAEHLTWTSWSATSATATGPVEWRDCGDDCAKATAWALPSASAPGTSPHSATPGAVRPAAASGTLGYAQIEGFWIDAGGPASGAQIAAAITGAESSFYPGIIQQGVDYCGSGGDRAGWGLWQITCGNSVPAYGTDFQLLDPWNNAEAAVAKYDEDAAAGLNGFDPWTTYQNGQYENYLESVSPDTALTDPGEYVQDGATPSGTPASPSADPGSTYGPALGGGGGGAVGPVLGSAEVVAPDGTVYVFSRDAGSGDLQATYQTAGTTTWATGNMNQIANTPPTT
jgi:hypothetical protein